MRILVVAQATIASGLKLCVLAAKHSRKAVECSTPTKLMLSDIIVPLLRLLLVSLLVYAGLGTI